MTWNSAANCWIMCREYRLAWEIALLVQPVFSRKNTPRIKYTQNQKARILCIRTYEYNQHLVRSFVLFLSLGGMSGAGQLLVRAKCAAWLSARTRHFSTCHITSSLYSAVFWQKLILSDWAKSKEEGRAHQTQTEIWKTHTRINLHCMLALYM